VSDTVRIVDPHRPGRGTRLRDYVRLTKPRIIELLLTTTLPAMVVAGGGWPGWWPAVAALIGGSLSAAGANTINQVIDADIDRMMRRTRSRPIAAGRVAVRPALLYGVALGTAGFVWLFVTTNLLAAVLSTAGLLLYVFVYSLFLKRTTTQNIVIGGAAGAVPPLVGWAVVDDALALPAWILFAVVFLWTPPHFWALALRYRDDYERAAVPMLPVVVGTEMTVGHIALYSVATVGVSLLLAPWVGWVYLTSVVVLGAWFIGGAFALHSEPHRAMRYFTATNGYLAGVFLAAAVDVLVLGGWALSGAALTAVLTAGSAAVVGPLVVIAFRELRTHPERRLVGRVRDTVEVLAAPLAMAILVVATWSEIL